MLGKLIYDERLPLTDWHNLILSRFEICMTLRKV
jgi:hypothetical protein